jgi:hypothetical protein
MKKPPQGQSKSLYTNSLATVTNTNENTAASSNLDNLIKAALDSTRVQPPSQEQQKHDQSQLNQPPLTVNTLETSGLINNSKAPASSSTGSLPILTQPQDQPHQAPSPLALSPGSLHLSPSASPGGIGATPPLSDGSPISNFRLKSPSLSSNFAYLANPAMTEWENFGFLTTLDARNMSRSNSVAVEDDDDNQNSIYSTGTDNNNRIISNNNKNLSSSPRAIQDFLNRIEVNSTINLRNPVDSHETIYRLFDRYTCGILSIKDGPNENPWRSIMWPLALEHGALYNAIAAMTKFHNAKNDKECRQIAMNHMKESFNLLAIGLSNKSIPLDIALATTLALALAEAWDRHISTGVAHIRGASAMLKRLIPKHQGTRLPQWLQFLFNSWLYLDVVSRLTSDSVEEKSLIELSDSEESEEDSTEHQTNEQSICTPATNQPEETNSTPEGIVELASFFESPDDASPKSTTSDRSRVLPRRRRSSSSTSSRRELKGFLFLGQGEEIDPLMGCGQTLFPLIGRVATLVHKIRRLPRNTLSIVSEAVELKRQLELWNPTLSPLMTHVEDPTWDLNSCLATAEAYRYAALLHLHQAVPEVPSLASHELAEKVMMLLASIPISSRTCIIHIFPLLVSGCEALPGEEREWVKDRWTMLDKRMHIGNINCTIEVVKEVWLRKDVLRRQQAAATTLQNGMGDINGDLTRHKVNGSGTAAAAVAANAATGLGGEIKTRRSSKDIATSISSAVSQAFGQANGASGLPITREIEDGIKGWSHWSVVMNEWGWEVLLG